MNLRLHEAAERIATKRKIAPKKRPHYPGPARFKALQLRQAVGWSVEEAAAQADHRLGAGDPICAQTNSYDDNRAGCEPH